MLTEEQVHKLAGGVVRRPDRCGPTSPIGQSTSVLAREAGITVPPTTRLLVVPVDAVHATQTHSVWNRERLAPVVTLTETRDDEEAVNLCQALLAKQGQGHTAAVHTSNPDRVTWFALLVPVSRLIVNGPAAQGFIRLGTGPPRSFTLGCGTAGGTSTSDNIGFRHLLNIRRIVEQTTEPVQGPHRTVSSEGPGCS